MIYFLTLHRPTTPDVRTRSASVFSAKHFQHYITSQSNSDQPTPLSCSCTFIKKHPVMRNQLCDTHEKTSTSFCSETPGLSFTGPRKWASSDKKKKRLKKGKVQRKYSSEGWVAVWCTRLCRRPFEDDLVAFRLRCYSGARRKVNGPSGDARSDTERLWETKHRFV